MADKQTPALNGAPDQVKHSAKIEAAAQKCLACATSGDRPYRSVADFIEVLSLENDWDHHEIIEVQTLVIRELIKQRKPNV